jgi:F-type H+-transporting ATPase subunit epsilon
MAEKLDFELVSPEKLVLSDHFEMVVVPGSEGDFGALPHHAPMITTIRPGVIDLYDGGKVAKRIFVAGGFAEVNEVRCTVLAEEAIPLEEITRDFADHRFREANVLVEEADTDHARAAAARALAVAEAMKAALDVGAAKAH